MIWGRFKSPIIYVRASSDKDRVFSVSLITPDDLAIRRAPIIIPTIRLGRRLTINGRRPINSIFADGNDTFRDNDGREGGAAEEGQAADERHGIGDCYRGQGPAVSEGFFADGSDRIRDNYRGEGGTAGEGVTFDGSDAAADGYRGQ